MVAQYPIPPYNMSSMASQTLSPSNYACPFPHIGHKLSPLSLPRYTASFQIIVTLSRPPPSSARALLAANTFMPTSMHSQISDWLHDTPPPSPPHLDASIGYLIFTKHCTTQGLLTRNTGGGTDSVFREVGEREAEISRGLAADDAPTIYAASCYHRLLSFDRI
ncbi:hypothetical protein BJY52DRAFT_391709 [Lactarius psammicola]|nr:hypothetical protein BJY52DRAFT_391709 [Lactarius psammicola]